MTEAEVRAAIAQAVKNIAPEADLSRVDADEDLRQALDIDSFDSLNLLMAIHTALRIDIPESDYGKTRTLRSLIDYLLARTAAPDYSNTNVTSRFTR